MADRTVAVRLRADISDYAAKLGVASRATSEFAGNVDKAQGKAREGYHSIGVGLAAAGALVVGGFLEAGREMANFENRMALVRTLSHATAAEMQQLRSSAMTSGAAFGFNANQVADAQAELIKAGISVKDVIGGALTGALTLAAAGQEDVASATETAAIAMTQFKLKGSDVPHIADLLAAGADKALGSVHDLSMGLQSGGLVAAQFGLSIDDTIGTLAAFAQHGLLAEVGGTDLRQMLLKLAAPSKESADTMARLGINVYDATGKFVGMAGLAGQLHDKMGNLTQAQQQNAMTVIFGSRAINGANILMAEGAQGMTDWTNRVNDSGFAALQASGKMNSLTGDLTKLRSALMNAFIGAGENANGPLRTMTQDATGAIDAWNGLPGPVKTVTEAVVLAGGAATLAGAAALLAIPKWTAMNAALAETSVGAVTARGAMLGLTRITVVAGILGGIAEAAGVLDHALQPAAPSVDRLTSSLLDLGNTGRAQGELTKAFGKDLKDFDAELHKVVNPTAGDKFVGSWIVRHNPFQNLSDWAHGTHNDVEEAQNDFKKLDTALAGMVTSGHADAAAKGYSELVTRAKAAGISTEQLAKAFPEYAAALDASAASAKEASTGVDKFGNSVGAAADQTDRATKAAKDYNDQLHAMADPVFALGSALSDLKDKQTAATKAVKDHGAKSAAAKQANLDLAQSALTVTDAATTLAGALRDGTTSAGGMRDQLRTWVKQGVITKAQADAIATSVHDIIKQGRTLDGLNPKFTVDAQTAAAQHALEVLKQTITNLPDGTVVIHTVTRGGSISTTQLHKADGGYISGPGGPRDDLIPAWLSNGEYVMPASSTRKYMPLLDAMRAGKFADGGIVGYATGGKVTEGNVVGKLNRIIAHPGASAQQIQAAVDAVSALSAAWANTIQAMQDAAQKRKLVQDLAGAQAALRKALGEHGKSAAADVSNARGQVASAKTALAGFNEQQKQSGITARIQAGQAAIAARQTLEANKESWAFDHMTAQQQVDTIARRMAGEKKYSDAWMSDAHQREQIEQSIAADAAQAAQAAKDALDQRTAALSSWADITQQVSVGFAPSMKFLISNAESQLHQFVEWTAQLAAARTHGVSEAVISTLGLDQGPQSLAQLRQINQGSATQVAQLNNDVAQRAALAAAQATREQPLTVKAYDTGGAWPSGTLGVNLSGHDEWVSTSLPTATPVVSSGPLGDLQVQVFLGDREITDILDARITRREVTARHQQRRVLAS